MTDDSTRHIMKNLRALIFPFAFTAFLFFIDRFFVCAPVQNKFLIYPLYNTGNIKIQIVQKHLCEIRKDSAESVPCLFFFLVVSGFV